MGQTLEWGLTTASKGVRCRRFEVTREDHVVPAILWEPDDEGVDAGRPLVLVGHGGSGSKDQDYVTALARRLVRHLGYAVAAIDGPVHGDRRPDGDADARLILLEFSQRWSSDESVTDFMVHDWQAVLDALEALPGFGGPVGYWGLSMGTIFGLPLVAAEPRISVAVLGLMGLTGPTRARIEADAPRVTCPVLFLAQWDDELFAIERALALFGALGSTDKRLHAHPGTHSAVPPEEFAASELFLSRHLGGRHLV
jgi:pimeloyl-ACP methyl ester carboxylesterase